MATHLFLASTPFNMLTSAMVAFELPAEDEAYLGLIDQPAEERPFVSALNTWKESPFKQIERLSQQAKGRGKRQQRQSAFNKITSLLERIKPDKIYTGNDRRIEFQYAMHHSRKLNKASLGVYLDDGTYSYLGRETHWLKDKLIDNLVKKLTYGRWWQQPSTIGASNWINQAILAFPKSAVPEIQEKSCFALPENLQRPEFVKLAQHCLHDIDFPLSALSYLDALLLLPHSSVAKDRTKQKLSYWLNEHGDKIAFKHHPRTALLDKQGDKEEWLIPQKAMQVPAGIPMEVLLPLIQPTCLLAGDVSTALLTAKWLRPELDVTAFSTPDTSPQWLDLLNLLKIKVESV